MSAGEDFLFRSLFQVGVFAQVEENLYDLVLKVGEGVEPLRSNNLQRLNLPLISNEHDKEDVMLAAALALGDDDVVEKVTKLFPKQKLGIGLTKFCTRRITQIINSLESIEDVDIDIKIVSMIVQLGIYDDDCRSGKPRMIPLPDECNYDYKQLSNAARKCGMYLMNTSNFKSTILPIRNAIRFNLSNRWEGDEQAVLTNFNCSYEVDAKVRVTETASEIRKQAKPDYSTIRLVGGTSKKYKRLEINEEAITELYAKKISAEMAKIAAKRLRRLVSQYNLGSVGSQGNEGVSLEHIAVSSGYTGELLSTLEASDQVIITENSSNIHMTLQATLEKNIPPPEDDEVKGRETPSAALALEISQFITNYLKLVLLSYCETPRLNGTNPSGFVPKFSVLDDALQDSCWTSTAMMVHSTRRTLVKTERERIIRSRKLVTIGRVHSAAFIGFWWMLMSWLSFKSTQVFLSWVSFHRHSFDYALAPYLNPLTLVISQALSLMALRSLGRMPILRSAFNVDADEPSSHLVKCCVEYILRTISVWRGRPTPYDHEMTGLKQSVQTQYKTWKIRIAKNDFYTALKRKRITNRECVLLLTEFAHTYTEIDGEEIVEGQLPVKLSEAEEFLKLRVDGQESCTEVSIDADQALKNYLSSEDNGGSGSAMEGLLALSSSVHSCVEFSEGDRVIVKDKEEGDEYEEDSIDSSDERYWQDDSSEEGLKSSALVSKRSKTGSVVFSTATLCFIHFDGEEATTPTPIPIRRCSKLDEQPTANIPIERDISPTIAYETLDDNNIKEEEEEEQEEDTAVASKPQQKARTVEEALQQGGWKLKRSKNHLIYSRRVKITGKSDTQKQSVTMAKTPSDRRGAKKALSLLRKLNEELNEALREDEEEPENLSSGDPNHLWCKACSQTKAADSYSKSQLKKGENRKCKACVSTNICN